MPDRRDHFDALRRPVVPLEPRPEFAASLRRRLQEELGMIATDHGTLAMVHLRVDDADRAIEFFGALFDWEAERVEWEGVNHYTLNTATTVRLLEDPNVPAVVPNYLVDDVGEAVRAIEEAGGRVVSAEPTPEGGGWARGEDDQGVPLLVYRRGDYGQHRAPMRQPSGDVGLMFIRADAEQAERFYGRVLGWRLTRAHAGSSYFDAVDRVGVFDEAAAFGSEVVPTASVYFAVDALQPVLRRIEALGGRAGAPAQDMGPYFTAVCTDDQGTAFGVMATALD